MLQSLLDDYVEMFNENFPTFMVVGMDEEEIVKIIEKCLKDKEPYKEYDKDVIY